MHIIDKVSEWAYDDNNSGDDDNDEDDDDDDGNDDDDDDDDSDHGHIIPSASIFSKVRSLSSTTFVRGF